MGTRNTNNVNDELLIVVWLKNMGVTNFIGIENEKRARGGNPNNGRNRFETKKECRSNIAMANSN